MNEKEFASSLGIEKAGEYKNDAYVIDVSNSLDWGRLFTKIDTSSKVEQLQDNQVVSEQGTSISYLSEDEQFMITLIADFEGDVYSVVINKL